MEKVTRRQIEEIARIAYTSKNLELLQRIGKDLLDKPATDEYYWAYLSLTPDIFYRVFFEELERTHGEIKETLTILHEAILLQVTPTMNVSLYPSYLDGNFRVFGYDRFLSASHDQANKYLSLILQDKGLDKIFQKLVTIEGVVICGGLPAACVYQYWSSNPSNKDVIFSIECNGIPFKIFRRDYDIDIFIGGRDINSVPEIVKNIQEAVGKADWIENQHVIYTSVNNVPIQIIKRLYTSIEEILLGFDLDSSAVAYFKGKFLLSPRFISAVQYGQNVIIPQRQSKSYLYRLHKYLLRGFTIFFPGNLNTNPQQSCIEDLVEYLLHYIKLKQPKISDYIELLVRNPTYIVERQRESIKSREDARDVKLKKLNNLKDIEEIEKLKLLIVEDNRAIEELTKDILNYATLFSIHNMDLKTWLIREPSTQITGTFNPMTTDFLGCQTARELGLGKYKKFNYQCGKFIKLEFKTREKERTSGSSVHYEEGNQENSMEEL